MTLGTMSLGPRLPETIVDCHLHFLAPDQPFHATLGKIGAPAYTAEQYATDCGHLPITKTVHVEALADEGLGEVAHVEALASSGACKVAAIVAACDLSAPDAAAKLDQIKAASSRVRGIRKILDYDGKFGEDNGTHVACKEHNTDYLRDPKAAPAFEKGFALLAERDLSFDLQCCPSQMEAAAALLKRHPTGTLSRAEPDSLDRSRPTVPQLSISRVSTLSLARSPGGARPSGQAMAAQGGRRRGGRGKDRHVACGDELARRDAAGLLQDLDAW